MSDHNNVPTPDEVDSWSSRPRKKEGRLRRLFAKKTIDVGTGVGEAATKVGRAVPTDEPDERRARPIEEKPSKAAPEARLRPRRIEFAAGVLQHEAISNQVTSAESRSEPPPVSVPPPPASQPSTGSRFTDLLPQPPAVPSDRPVETRSPLLEAMGFSLFATDEERREPGPTPSEEDADGRARIYRIVGPESVELELGDIAWDNGERSITVLDRLSSPSKFDGLVRRLRMSVQPIDAHEAVVELSVARFKDPRQPSLMRAEIPTLGKEIGVDIIETLISAGARQVGTKGQVLGAQHNRRGYWCAVFAGTHPHVPAVASLLVRIIPVSMELSS